MKNKNKRKCLNEDADYLQVIIDDLEQKNRELQYEFHNQVVDNIELSAKVETAKNENNNLRAILKLQMLVMAVMGLLLPSCNESELGRSLALNIKNYYINVLKSLNKLSMTDDEDADETFDEDEAEEE